MNQKQSLLLFATAFGVAVAMSQPAIAKVCKHTIKVQDCAFWDPFKAYVGTKAKWSSRVRSEYGLLYWNWKNAAHKDYSVFNHPHLEDRYCARFEGRPCRTFRPILILRPHPGTAPIVPR